MIGSFSSTRSFSLFSCLWINYCMGTRWTFSDSLISLSIDHSNQFSFQPLLAIGLKSKTKQSQKETKKKKKSNILTQTTKEYLYTLLENMLFPRKLFVSSIATSFGTSYICRRPKCSTTFQLMPFRRSSKWNTCYARDESMIGSSTYMPLTFTNDMSFIVPLH